ncbi:uncharacterized protein FTOL_02326 [Fusarium torulosum]|uniref:Uncharacterized protein n=1 Tax=Fusarium torulosum TaxID=33205 RepID=A0AAE8M1T8_9HYPO|nr:uncharacterized protein FTOL_02326 [Fusarium torulosum]
MARAKTSTLQTKRAAMVLVSINCAALLPKNFGSVVNTTATTGTAAASAQVAHRPKSKRSYFHHVFESAAHVNEGSSVSSLHKRDDQYTVNVWPPLRNAMVALDVWGISYPNSGDWYPNEPIWDRTLDMATPLCSDASFDLNSRISGNNDGLVTEHIFEKQSLLRVFGSAI